MPWRSSVMSDEKIQILTEIVNILVYVNSSHLSYSCSLCAFFSFMFSSICFKKSVSSVNLLDYFIFDKKRTLLSNLTELQLRRRIGTNFSQ